MSSFRYRPDIDGLRAVAVLLVVLFHANHGFSGGYVGVDVFFVISGFLITGLILKEQENGTFKLSRFWLRRIRRIVPAVCCVVLATLVAGAFILLPADYVGLARSAMAQQFMISNFYFWQDAGYFAGPSEFKPLLHTWSLGVEEQFYLIYPFLMIALRRYSKCVVVSVLAILAGLSFAASVWGVWYYPEATFYLLPTRAWELLMGSLLCFLPRHPNLPHSWANGIALFGMGIILGSAMGFDSETPFPGLAAWVPCFGTVAVIYANTDADTWLRKTLATKPAVQIGLISYSLYLWHWPILAYLNYHFDQDVTPNMQLSAVVLSIFLAWISWKFIETPIRKRNFLGKSPALLSGVTASVILLLLIAGLVRKEKGFYQRYEPEVASLLESIVEPSNSHGFVTMEMLERDELPTYGDPHGTVRCLIWGDSHAQALLPAFDASCRQHGILGFQATHSSTIPLVGFKSRWKLAAPPEFNDAVVDYLRRNEFDVVILAGIWFRDSEQTDFVPSVHRTIETLNDLGVQVVIVRDVAYQQGDVSRLLLEALRKGQNIEEIGIFLGKHRQQNRICDEAFLNYTNQGIEVVDPAPFFVDSNGIWPAFKNGKCLYRDLHHLSVQGAQQLIPLFDDVFQTLKQTGRFDGRMRPSVTKNDTDFKILNNRS